MDTRHPVQVPNFESDHSRSMANEFDKRVDEGETVWTCRNCQLDIMCRSKPRDHVCTHHVDENEQQDMQNRATPTTIVTTTTTTSTTTTPGRTSMQSMSAATSPFAFPPPPVGGQQFRMGGHQFEHPGASDQMSAMQWQMIQQDQF